MGWFVYRAFKALRDEKAAGIDTASCVGRRVAIALTRRSLLHSRRFCNDHAVFASAGGFITSIYCAFVGQRLIEADKEKRLTIFIYGK